VIRDAIQAWIELLRLGNLVMIVVAVGVGAYLAGGTGAVPRGALAGFALALVAAGINVLNDFLDLEIDRVNRPDRPLPRGAVGREPARAAFVIFLFGGVLLSRRLGPEAMTFATAVVVLLIIYCTHLNRAGLAGNLAVAGAGGSALFFGALAGGDARAGLAPAVFAFLIHLGREILKDVQDLAGDVRNGRRTLPVRLGVRGALRLAAVPLLVLVALTPVPYLVGSYGLAYLAVVVLTADVVLVAVAIRLLFGAERASPGRLSAWLKAAMGLGLVAVALGPV
jgi:geranylgeranylglycerol-phosphate geranylgeranyltransferase